MLDDTSVLAFVTLVHLSLAVVRRHRSAGAFGPFVLPSFAFVAVPWLWSSPAALLAGAVAHAVWFVACEIIAPAPVRMPAAVASSSGTIRPARESIPAVRSDRSAPGADRAAAPARAATEGFTPVPVLAVLDEAADIKTFRLVRPDGFEFKAGQFLPVRVSIGGKPHVRCYSISSSPDARRYIEISVRQQGLVSTILHATLRTGSTLGVRRPAGGFVYPEGDDRPLALLAGGIGITPLLSMMRFALTSEPARPVTLLYSVRDRKSLAFLSELRVIAERHPHTRIGIVLSADASAPPPWRAGHIDMPMLRQHVPHPTHTIFCVCGPLPMMEAMQRMLLAEGVPQAQIRSERFATAVAAASLNAPAPDRQPVAARDGVGEYRLRFSLSSREASVDGSRTLLEAAESEGVSIASSCRAGVCQACRTRLIEGEADCQSSVLDADDRAAGFVLPCVTYATSDCVLEA